MSGNGKRKPPRPRIQMLGGAPSAEEGAAVMAALEQFLAETAPPPAAPEPSRWLQAALREGVERAPRLSRWRVGA